MSLGSASPMNVLVGHENTLGLLERCARVQRPAHAYVFTGMQGIGKKTAALKFASMLNCPISDSDQHNRGSVCRRILEQNHPDLLVEKPERGMIRIDRIRYIQNFFRYPPAEAVWRIVIIDDAHLMNAAAQNALLKTLEEPPTQRMIILVTAKPNMLFPTVRSRCRTVRFGPLSQEVLANFLEQEKGILPDQASILAGLGGGSLSQALAMDSSRFSQLRERVISALVDPLSKGMSGLLDLSGEISSDRQSVSEAIQIALSFLRDVMRGVILTDPSTLINPDLAKLSSEMSSKCTSEQIFQVYEELVKGLQLVDWDINVNRSLVVDVMMLRIAHILLGHHFGVPPGEEYRKLA